MSEQWRNKSHWFCISLQIEINHRKHHYTTTLDFTNLLVNFGIFAHGKYKKHKKQNDTFLFLISDLDLLVVHRPNNDVNYLIGGGRHASVIWNCRNNADEPISAFTESNVLPIIWNTFFSCDLEYLGLQLVIQVTLGKSLANLVLLRWSTTKLHWVPWVPTAERYLCVSTICIMQQSLILKVTVQLDP